MVLQAGRRSGSVHVPTTPQFACARAKTTIKSGKRFVIDFRKQ
jgi:hypothetical protein